MDVSWQWYRSPSRTKSFEGSLNTNCSISVPSSRRQAPVESESLSENCDPVPNAKSGVLSGGCDDVQESRGAGTRSCASSSSVRWQRGGQRVQRRKRATAGAGCVSWKTTPPFACAGRSFDVSRRKVVPSVLPSFSCPRQRNPLSIGNWACPTALALASPNSMTSLACPIRCHHEFFLRYWTFAEYGEFFRRSLATIRPPSRIHLSSDAPRPGPTSLPQAEFNMHLGVHPISISALLTLLKFLIATHVPPASSRARLSFPRLSFPQHARLLVAAA